MKAYEKVAVELAQALVDARWESARGLLVRQLQSEWSNEKLATALSIDVRRIC